MIEPLQSGLPDYEMICLRRSGLQIQSRLFNKFGKPTFTAVHADAAAGGASKSWHICSCFGHHSFSFIVETHGKSTVIIIGEESGCSGLRAADFDTSQTIPGRKTVVIRAMVIQIGLRLFLNGQTGTEVCTTM